MIRRAPVPVPPSPWQANGPSLFFGLDGHSDAVRGSELGVSLLLEVERAHEWGAGMIGWLTSLVLGEPHGVLGLSLKGEVDLHQVLSPWKPRAGDDPAARN